MADRNELLRGKSGNPSLSNPSSRAFGVREEGEVSSGGEDESVLRRALSLEPSNLSLTSNAEKSMKIGATASSSHTNHSPLPVPGPSLNLQRPMPQTIPRTYQGNSFKKKMLYSKLPNNRNLSWQKKRPLDDHNLVISFSDDESESDATPAYMQVQVQPQMPRSGPTSSMARNPNLGPNALAQRPNTTLQPRVSLIQSNGVLGSSSDKVLESLRHEIALREKSLKSQKLGPFESTEGRPAKRMKVEPPNNGNQSYKEDQLHLSTVPSGYAKGDSNQSLSRQNGDENISVSALNNNSQENNGRLVLTGAQRSVDAIMQPDTSVWLNQNAENTDSQAQLQLLLEQEDAQDQELEHAQELRRRLEREERQALKAYRKAQRALFEANEKCSLLQKKRDHLSSRVNSLLENSSTSNAPWPLCWHDPRDSPSDQPADGARIAMSGNNNREEGQLTDSANTKDQVEEAALSDVDKRGSPSGNSSPQDYEALEASLRSALVARYCNKTPLNCPKSAERGMVDQPYIETQENHSQSPNETQVSPSGTTSIARSVPMSLSAGGNNLPLKDFIESADEKMVNQEKLPSGEPQENISRSPNETQVSSSGITSITHSVPMTLSAGGDNLRSTDFTEAADNKMVDREKLPSGEPQENISQSPNGTQVSPCGTTSINHSVPISLFAGANSLPSKDFTEPADEKMLNQETQKNIRPSLNETQLSPCETISLSAGGSNLPSKDFTEPADEEMVDQEKLLFGEPQDKIPQSPNETQLSPCGTTSIIHSIPISPSTGGNNLPSKDFSESADDIMVGHDKLPFGEPQENVPPSPEGSYELPLLVNVSISDSISVSHSESIQTPLKVISKPAVNEPRENVMRASLKTIIKLAASHSDLPPSAVRNACVHIKQMVISSTDGVNNGSCEGMDIVNGLEQAREDTGVWGPQVDPFWPFCIFELRGRCNDEECRWQHAKDYDWRKFKPHTSLTSPSGLYQHVVHVSAYPIGSYLIKDRPHLACSVQAQGLWQYWQRGFCASFPVPVSVQRLLPPDAPCLSFRGAPVARRYNEISSLKILLEEDLPEDDKCLELALDSSFGKQKVLAMLSRALERNPTSISIWIVYLHFYYMKKKDLGKDDMFRNAVNNNEYSYDLWLMYINSRLKLEDQLSTISEALNRMCQLRPPSDKEIKDQSSVILDLYLQMVNVMCMSGHAGIATSRIFEFSSNTFLTDIRSCLVAPDKCIFWITSIYLSIYGKLPEGILEQFELEKDLNFVIDWPSVKLRTDEQVRVFELFKHAFVDVDLVEKDVNSPKTEEKYLKELHFLAISHVKCMVAVKGLIGATDLLVKYKEIYPNCVELALILARLGENTTCAYNSNRVVAGGGFEVAISDWPRQSQGLQCIWNQYAEHCLANKRFNFARDLLSRWFGDTKLEIFVDAKSGSNNSISQKEQLFGLLNFCLYQLMQDDLLAAHLTLDKALKLADQEFYKHCLREHVMVHLLKKSLVDQRDISSRVVLDLIGSYLKDARACPVRKVLSRKYYQDIKSIRARQLLDEWLGPVSVDCSSINSILEMCYGESLIPEKSGIKELVNLAESVTQISPANYRFALSVCRFVVKNFGFDDIGTMGVRFWAGSVLVNSIFQSVPVAPEPVWVEGAEALVKLKLFEISNRYLEQSVSVYPFSLKLWQLHLSLSKTMNENGDRIVEAAKGRGIELSP